MEYHQRWGGKGAAKTGQSGARHQKVRAYPSTAGKPKDGTDVLYSGYWDEGKTCWDAYWTPRPISSWWRTEVSEWVFMGQSELRAGEAFYDPQFWGNWGKKLRMKAKEAGKDSTVDLVNLGV